MKSTTEMSLAAFGGLPDFSRKQDVTGYILSLRQLP
jgi:hypothetical protein